MFPFKLILPQGLLYTLFRMYYTHDSFIINYFNYSNYFTIILIISNDYYSNWDPIKLIILYCDQLYILIRIISIKLIYYNTNNSIKMVQAG